MEITIKYNNNLTKKYNQKGYFFVSFFLHTKKFRLNAVKESIHH